MTFKFMCFVDKDEFESFLLGIKQVNETPLIIFGGERISCNTMTCDESMMFSGMLNPFKSTIEDDKTYPVSLDLAAITRMLSEAPAGMISLAYDGVLFYVSYDEDDSSLRHQYECIQRHRLELPKFDYPLKFDIDSKHLEYIVTNLKDSPSVIFSREVDGLLIADANWENFTTIKTEDISYNVNTPGAFATMISKELMLKAFEVLSLYESVRIGLGEDIPIVFLGTSERLKMGFMIGPEVEEEADSQ